MFWIDVIVFLGLIFLEEVISDDSSRIQAAKVWPVSKSAHFILFRVSQSTEILVIFFINRYQVSISMTPSEVLYGRKCWRSLGPKIINQSICVFCPQLFYILICIIIVSIFSVFIFPYQNFEDEIYIRWVECNTPFPEYVLRYVFWFFDCILLIFSYLFLFYDYLNYHLVFDPDFQT